MTDPLVQIELAARRTHDEAFTLAIDEILNLRAENATLRAEIVELRRDAAESFASGARFAAEVPEFIRSVAQMDWDDRRRG